MNGISGNAGDIGTIINIELEGLKLGFRVIDVTALQLIRNFAKILKCSIIKYNQDRKLNRSGEMNIIKKITELDPNVQLAHIDKKYLPILEEYSKKLGLPYVPVESIIPGSDVINIVYPGRKATVMSFIIAEIEKKTVYDLKQKNLSDEEAKIKASEMNKFQTPEECMQLVGAGLPQNEFEPKLLTAFSGTKIDFLSMQIAQKKDSKEKEPISDFSENKSENFKNKSKNFNRARSFDYNEREILASVTESALKKKLENQDHIGIGFKKEDIVKDSFIVKDGRSYILINDNVTDLVLVIDSKKVLKNPNGTFTAVAAKNEKISCMDENQNHVRTISGKEYKERAIKYMKKMRNANNFQRNSSEKDLDIKSGIHNKLKRG